jgi:hypothetical protein
LKNLIELFCTNNKFSKNYKNYLNEYCRNKKIHLII